MRNLNFVEFVDFNCDTGTHWCFEIMQQLINRKAEPAASFKTKFMLEALTIDSVQQLNDMPSPRLLNTNTRLKYFLDENYSGLKVRTIQHARC